MATKKALEAWVSDELLVGLSGVTVERERNLLLNGVAWEVRAGERWVVFGPNGAGKTTLLQVAMGYLWPTSGVVDLLGYRLGEGGADLRELRRGLGLVSDAVRRMIAEHLTGLEVIVTGPRAHLNIFDEVTPGEEALAREMARVTALPESLLRRRFEVMSTGERQRVLIARALAARPRLIIFDEPCTGLDLAGRELVLRSIRQAAANHGPDGPPAMVLTTHHVEEIAPEFTHALLLRQGRAVASGAMEEVFTSGALSELFDLPLAVGQDADGRWWARAR